MKYDFTDDYEKMKDFKKMDKGAFLCSYSYLTEEEYDATLEVYAKESVHGLIMKTIYDWVSENFGQNEANDPSWSISELANEVAKHAYELHGIIEQEGAREDVKYVAKQMGVELTKKQLDVIADDWLVSDARCSIDTETVKHFIKKELNRKGD